MLVYVADIIITGNMWKKRGGYKMAQQSGIKKLGRPKYFLEIKNAYSKQGILMSQRKFSLIFLSKPKRSTASSSALIDPSHRFVQIEKVVRLTKGGNNGW